MPATTPRTEDTQTVLEAMRDYRARYTAAGCPAAFPDETVQTPEGAVILSPMAGSVTAFAQGHDFQGRRMRDRGVIFTMGRTADDDDEDERLARIIVGRAALVARARQARADLQARFDAGETLGPAETRFRRAI